MNRRRAARIAAGVLVSIVAIYLAFFGLQLLFRPAGARLWSPLVSFMYHIAIWVGLSLAIVRLCRRWPLVRGRLLRTVLLHGAASLAFFSAYAALAILPTALFEHGGATAAGLAGIVEHVFLFRYNFFWYWGIVALVYLHGQRREWKRQAIAAERVETELRQAQLDVLKMQLHPHFLFNALHAVSSLLQADPAAARDVLGKLRGLLLRMSAEVTRHTVPLREELDLARRYLEIELVRFPDRLTVLEEVEAETLGALVPNLVLQPLVENAIKHGVAPHAGMGTVTIRARREGDTLRLAVTDGGPPRRAPRTDAERPGLGLRNTRSRLAALYGDRQSFRATRLAPAGYEVALRIPWETED